MFFVHFLCSPKENEPKERAPSEAPDQGSGGFTTGQKTIFEDRWSLHASFFRSFLITSGLQGQTHSIRKGSDGHAGHWARVLLIAIT
jgi:hypothetical protein